MVLVLAPSFLLVEGRVLRGARDGIQVQVVILLRNDLEVVLFKHGAILFLRFAEVLLGGI